MYFHDLIREVNPKLNLTRIINFENMVRKHYVDSLIITNILKEANINLKGPCLDIGSGAGFPGIPLSIFYKNLEFILADTRIKRTDFFKRSFTKLKLNNVNIIEHSINIKNCPKINSCITRALEKIPLTLNRITEGLEENGLAIFMKGVNCDLEIEEAKKILEIYLN